MSILTVFGKMSEIELYLLRVIKSFIIKSTSPVTRHRWKEFVLIQILYRQSIKTMLYSLYKR